MKKGKIFGGIVIFAAILCMILYGEKTSVYAQAFSPRTSAPAKSSSYYYSTNNPFYPSYAPSPGTIDSSGNCTWYAWGRAYEILGSKPSLPTCWAGGWWSNNKSYSSGQTPKLGAIACWSNHVAVVEAVNGSTITISESSYVSGNYSSSNLFATRTLSATKPNNGSDTFYGYIYIGDFGEPSVNLSVETGDVVDITETNAMVRGMINNTSQVKSGMKCGVRLGTSSGNYNVKTYWEDVSQAAYNSGASFPIWFNCNNELGVTLKKGTTYYYQMLMSYGGKTYYGSEKSFVTNGDSTKPTVTKAEITSNTNGSFTVKGTGTDNIGVASFIFDVISSSSVLKSKNVTASGGQASATFAASELSSVYRNGASLTINVYAVDKAGNKSDKKSVAVTLKYDTQNPVVSALTATSTEAEKFMVNATATDDTSVAKLILTIWGPGQSETSGAKKVEVASKTYTGTFSISDIRNTSAGVYTIKAVAVDAYGKQSAAKTTTVNVDSAHVHSYSVSDYDEDTHYKVCECGAVSEVTAHTLQEVIAQQPTKEKEGYKYFVCVNCEYKSKYIEIPRLEGEGNEDNPSKPGDGEADNPSKSGDGEADNPSKPGNTETGNPGKPGSGNQNNPPKDSTNQPSVPPQGSTQKNNLNIGVTFTDKKTGVRCEITGKDTATYKEASIGWWYTETVPDTVRYNNKVYKVTAIGNNAFKNCKSLEYLIIGKNVTKIGKNAFRGCKNLRQVLVKSKKLKKVGSGAFKGVRAKCEIKVPKSKYKAYKKLFRKGGLKRSVRVIK